MSNTRFEIEVAMHKQSLNIADVYMKVIPMAHPFFMDITLSVDIKRGKGEKSVSDGQIRYTIRIIYVYEKKSLISDLPLID